MPCSRTSSNTMTARPAAGPLTCSGEPASAPTTMPPMMPVIRPFSGGTPEATAMPMHRGIATRNTTIDAVKSRMNVVLRGWARSITEATRESPQALRLSA